MFHKNTEAAFHVSINQADGVPLCP